MSDLEYRQLIRNYQEAPTEQNADLVINHAFRVGAFSLSSMKAGGIAWEYLKPHLHRLNPRAILSPSEVELYKQMVLETASAHPDFVNEPEFFVNVSAQESWAPSWPGSMLSMHIGFWDWAPVGSRYSIAKLSPRKTRKLKIDTKAKEWRAIGDSWGPGIKITFWGMDDTGMEQEIRFPQHASDPDTRPLATDTLEDILRRLPVYLTRQWLRDNGFYNA